MKKFTLLELIIVMAILGILISLLLPSLRNAREHTKMAVCLSNQNQLGKRIFLFAHEHNQQIPPYNQKERNGIKVQFHEIATGHNTRTFINTGGHHWKQKRNLAFLWSSKKDILADQTGAQLLYCPAQQNKNFKFDTYSKPNFPTNSIAFSWQQTSRVRAGYNYNILRQADKVAKYQLTSLFDDETILLTDIFTQAQDYFLKDLDLLGHGAISSFAYTRGDGSSRIKRSKTLIQTIRARNWESVSDLNYMGELLQ
jgi:prepilin-type N-terminal cleavage/methylation domain-containing protein